jgi:hypothetical protein
MRRSRAASQLCRFAAKADEHFCGSHCLRSLSELSLRYRGIRAVAPPTVCSSTDVCQECKYCEILRVATESPRDPQASPRLGPRHQTQSQSSDVKTTRRLQRSRERTEGSMRHANDKSESGLVQCPGCASFEKNTYIVWNAHHDNYAIF